MTKTYEMCVIHFLPFYNSNTLLSLSHLAHKCSHRHTMYNLTLPPNNSHPQTSVVNRQKDFYSLWLEKKKESPRSNPHNDTKLIM